MSSISRWIPVVLRVLLGGLFLMSGAMKLMPSGQLPPMPPAASAYILALGATGYTMPLIAVIEVIAGGLLIAGYFVPLSLTVLAPIIVNIALFHVLLAPSIPVVIFLLASELALAWYYRDAFAGLLRPGAAPASASAVRAPAAERGFSRA